MGLFSLYVASPGHRDGAASPRSSSPARISTPRPLSGPMRVFKSSSSQNLQTTTLANSNATLANSTLSVSHVQMPTSDLNTLPDPRASSDNIMGTRTPPTEVGQHPDLSNEVAALSTKLINAINHQTTLDDTLQSTRHELDTAREHISQLVAAVKEHEELVVRGLLIKRSDAEKEEARLKRELETERATRAAAEKQRKSMEMELENLTSALFEEANEMVAEARRGNDQAERKNEQLRLQLRDSEVLLQTHQQQLRELKVVLEEVQIEKEQSERPQPSTGQQTPLTASQEDISRSVEMQIEPPSASSSKPVSADQPLRFAHLIKPVLRMDLAAYDEFYTILKSANRGSPASRINSGSFGGLNVTDLTNASNSSRPSSSSTPQPAHVTTPTVSTSSPVSPNLPGSFNPSSPSDTSSSIGLEKSKFYKRILTEDIDPTLRLDTAPGLSWLARRNVVSSMLSSSLAIEPWPPGSRFYSPVFPCALCGEQRKEELYVRRHRFRTSDSEDAQRYPLCEYCLERVRATCELVGFLRLVRTGHWRADVPAECRAAWVDCVRLRERMFWARVAGGVVPVRPAEEPGKPRDVTGRSSLTEEGQAQDVDVDGGRAIPRTPSPQSQSEDAGGESRGSDESGEAVPIARQDSERQSAIPGSFK